MSSRAEAKQRARAERLAREHAEQAAATRRRRLWRLGAVVALAAVVVVIAVVVSGGSGDDEPETSGGDVNAMFGGIPQSGTRLGRADAPATLTEFADLQCPFCADYSRNVLPTVVERYVRSGQLKLEFRTLTFIGQDSETAGRAAAAASLQNRMFPFVEQFYFNQGEENSGYVSDDFLRDVAGAVDGLDVDRLMQQRDGPQAAKLLGDASAEAQQHGIQSTPSFLLAKQGGAPQAFDPGSLAVDEFTKQLDEALAGT